jgi:5-methylcytosine-specific restriction enzyme A
MFLTNSKGLKMRGICRGKKMTMTNFYKTARWKSKRVKILKLDEYQFQECKLYGKSKEASTVHHINPLRNKLDLRLTTWNLVSLCGNCHVKMHE